MKTERLADKYLIQGKLGKTRRSQITIISPITTTTRGRRRRRRTRTTKTGRRQSSRTWMTSSLIFIPIFLLPATQCELCFRRSASDECWQEHRIFSCCWTLSCGARMSLCSFKARTCLLENTRKFPETETKNRRKGKRRSRRRRRNSRKEGEKNLGMASLNSRD